jgi:hypothetical protein
MIPLDKQAIMDEEKTTHPRIFKLDEAGELTNEIRDLIVALKKEKQRLCGMVRKTHTTTEKDTLLQDRVSQFISNMKFLAIALEHGSVSFTEEDMRAASILYHNTEWEMFHVKLDHPR